MKRFLWAAFVLLMPTLPAFGQAVTSTVALGPTTTTGSSSGINEQRSGTQFHQLVWRVTGTIASCTVAVDSSADGITWSAGGVITGQNCTSNGSSSVGNSVVNFVRVTATALSGGGTLTAVYSGYATNPVVGTITSIATTSPITGGTITTTGTIACATCVTAASALTSNQVIVGGGSQASAVAPYLIGDGTTQLSIGPADTVNNGILGLKGKTSGTATFTAPAVAGTSTNPVVMSNNIAGPNGTSTAPTYNWNNGYGLYFGAGVGPTIAVNTADNTGFAVNETRMLSTGRFTWCPSTTMNCTIDTGLSRVGAGVVGVGNGTAGNIAGLVLSGNKVFVTSNFSTAANTNLQTITGLSWTVPAVAANYSFKCELAYSQATGAAADNFGIQAATNNPTNIFATGKVWTAAATVTTGTLATLATTTATNIVGFTPGATATNFVAELEGTIENPAAANTFNIMVSTGTSADVITVLRGSYCTLF